jgi:hypothetical protein
MKTIKARVPTHSEDISSVKTSGTETRQLWTRPTLQRLDACKAQAGTNVHADGGGAGSTLS